MEFCKNPTSTGSRESAQLASLEKLLETGTSGPPTAALMPHTSAVAVVAPTGTSDSLRLIKELAKTLSPEEDASDLFARLAEELKKEKATSRLTPLTIPTRPITLTETSTSQPTTARTENPQIQPTTLTQETTAKPSTSQAETHIITPTLSPTKSPTEGKEETQGEEKERGEGEGHAEGSEARDDEEGSQGEEGSQDEEGSDNEEKEAEPKANEEGNGSGNAEEDGENVEKSGETEVVSEERTEVIGDESEKDVKEGEPEVEGEMREILLLDEDTSIDERTERRNSRMDRRLEEILATKRAGDEIPETQETTVEAEEAAPKTVEERDLAERKRKGKQVAEPQKRSQGKPLRAWWSGNPPIHRFRSLTICRTKEKESKKKWTRRPRRREAANITLLCTR